MDIISVSPVKVRTKVIAHIALGVVFIAAWEAASTWFVDPFWIAKPSVIAASLWTEIVEGDMLGHTTITPSLDCPRASSSAFSLLSGRSSSARDVVSFTGSGN